MPLREIEEKFTRSEIVILAWRSREQHYNLQKDNPTKKKKKRRQPVNPGDELPPDLPDEYFAKEDIYDERGRLIAKEGDLFLSQVGGEKAKNYFAHFGIVFPSGQPGDTVSKIRDESDISRQIREAYGIRK